MRDSFDTYDEDWSKPRPELPITQKRLLKLNQTKGKDSRNFAICGQSDINNRANTTHNSRAGSYAASVGSRCGSAKLDGYGKNHFKIGRTIDTRNRRNTYMEEVDSVIS